MKKTKLIATIASVCLSIALVAFGVFASNIGSVGMSSTISYQASDNIDVEILVTVEYSTQNVTYSDTKANKTFVDNTLTPSGNYTTVNAWRVSQHFSDEPLNLTGENALNLGDYAFIPASPNGSSIKYTITITNNGYYPIIVSKTEPQNIETGVVTLAVESNGLVGEQGDQIPAKDITTGTTSPYTFTAIYTLANNTTNLDTPHTFAPSYTLAAGQ